MCKFINLLKYIKLNRRKHIISLHFLEFLFLFFFSKNLLRENDVKIGYKHEGVEIFYPHLHETFRSK